MKRLFLALFICVFFVACSSENEDLDAWFKDQGISTSYGELYEEIDITLKNIAVGFDSLPYITTYYGSLGSFNDVEQSLYFDIKLTEANDTVWSFTPDTVFYKDIYEGTIPETQKNPLFQIYPFSSGTAEGITLTVAHST